MNTADCSYGISSQDLPRTCFGKMISFHHSLWSADIEGTLASTNDLAGGSAAFSADADGFMVQG